MAVEYTIKVTQVEYHEWWKITAINSFQRIRNQQVDGATKRAFQVIIATK